MIGLKAIRRALALLFFVPLCLAFGILAHDSPGALFSLPAKVQLVPVILSGSVAAVSSIVALTLLFGRVYCSVICPLGVAQDVMARLGARNRYSYRPEKKWLRRVSLVLFIAAFALGIPLLFGVLEPYSIFGRVAATTLMPLGQVGKDILGGSADAGNGLPVSAFRTWKTGVAPFLVTVSTFAVIAFIALKTGRTWCNTLCPVGTALGIFARFSLFRPRINGNSCTGCGRCARVCKAACIDAQAGVIDADRCVSCFNCISACNRNSITYSISKPGKNAPSEPVPGWRL